ncbi:hypothetical protein ACFY9C_23710 [Streptomyces filamentosus]|uniref:hypothetical protein n=1 Tax=Streptomyces filamentosus TaxID=67294 RepID=UPI0036E49DD2
MKWSSPPKLAEIARSTAVDSVCFHGSSGSWSSRKTSRMPSWNAEDPVDVISSWTRKSSWNRDATSISRPADVTLWTTSRTRR